MLLPFEIIKSLLEKAVQSGTEPELWLIINGIEYMIIAYDGYCTFQRCGVKGIGSGEIRYSTLEELYYAEQPVDNICLKNDWDKIEELDSLDIVF